VHIVDEVENKIFDLRHFPPEAAVYDMIYLLTAIGLSPGGRSTVHIYTQTIHRTIQNKQYIKQHNFGRVRAKIAQSLS
jgi:uncharacterized integral membrane protein